MSMISEQVKQLKAEAEWLENDQEKRLGSILRQAADTIEALSAKLAANSGWIPCSERLPENGQKVLVSINGETLEEIFEFQLPDEEDRECYEEEFQCGDSIIGWFTPRDGVVVGIYSGDTIILAWQPLPEAYHE